MKFKIRGFEVNTLTIIMATLVVLGVVYVYLEYGGGGVKEGYHTHAAEYEAAEVPKQQETGDDKVTIIKVNATQDNYNHYTGESMPAVFYGPEGSVAKVSVDSAGDAIIITTDKMGKNNTYKVKGQKPKAGGSASKDGTTVYYGPDGTKAVVFIDNTGNKAIRMVKTDGSNVIYKSVTVESITANPTIADNTDAYPENTSPDTTVAASGYDEAYSQMLPRGIPKTMIPSGDEDLYILKTDVVPPVCPACPSPIVKCNENGGSDKKPPPCPPCARCPEPKFDCKKVPNYGSGNTGANYYGADGSQGTMNGPEGAVENFLPQPVLQDYTTFGA